MPIHPLKVIGRIPPLRWLSTPGRKIAAIAGVSIAFAGSLAFAYVLAPGSGTGEATTSPIQGASSVAVAVAVYGTSGQAGTTTIDAPVVNGGNGAPIYFALTDGATGVPVQVTNIVVWVSSTSVAGCLTSWFSVTPGRVETGMQDDTTELVSQGSSDVTFVAPNSAGTFNPPLVLDANTSTAHGIITDDDGYNALPATTSAPTSAPWIVTMPADSVDNQAACVGATLTITVTVS
jgi:hypothetical protein